MTSLCLNASKKKREKKEAKPRTIRLPEELCISENQNDYDDLRSHTSSLMPNFCSEEAAEFSSLIFTSLFSAQPDFRLDWANLKHLEVFRIEIKSLLKLLQEARNLEVLGIAYLQFGLQEDEKESEINLVNLRLFYAGQFEGRGKIKFVTPELVDFRLKERPDPTFSQAVELAFPLKLKQIVVEECDQSMKQFKNLEALVCDAGLPDRLLTTFANLKRLQYPCINLYGDLSTFSEFSPRKERILSILRERKQLNRAALVIIFYGVLLEDELQLDQQNQTEIDLTEFHMKNYAKLFEPCRGLTTINYSSLTNYFLRAGLELPSDFHNKFCCLMNVKITDAVNKPGELLQFLAALKHPVFLDTVDAALDASNFYEPLAQVARIKKLNIFHTSEPIDLCKMNDFNFLLRFKDLQRFQTDFTLSMKIIENIFRKCTEGFYMKCALKKCDVIIGREEDQRIILIDKIGEALFDSAESLLEQLAKM